MTPAEQDKELREAIEDLISQVGNYWFCVAKETSDSRTLSEGEAMEQIMQLITADRERVALEARIEAAEHIQNTMVSPTGGYCDEISPNEIPDYIAELKQELERL